MALPVIKVMVEMRSMSPRLARGFQLILSPESYPRLTMVYWHLWQPAPSVELAQTSVHDSLHHCTIIAVLNCMHCNVSWTKTHYRNVKEHKQLVFVPSVLLSILHLKNMLIKTFIKMNTSRKKRGGDGYSLLFAPALSFPWVFLQPNKRSGCIETNQ